MSLQTRNLQQAFTALLRRNRVSGRPDGLAALLGVFMGASLAVHAWDLGWLGVWAWPVVLICIALGSFFTQTLLWNLVYPRLQRYPPGMRSAWVLVCLLAGFGLLEMLPLTIYPKTQVVQIAATGEKDPASKGSEVWLNALQSGRSAIPLQRYVCSGNWRPVEHLLMSPSEWQPSVLTCRVRTDQDIHVEFVMHDWSGEAEVRYNGQTMAEDLYDPGSSAQSLTLDVTLSPQEQWLRVFLLAATGVSLGFALLAVSLFFAGFAATPGSARSFPTFSWLGYAALMAAVWLVYLLAYWPGFFSPDALVQFEQVATASFRNDHPAFHTMLLWLLTRVWMSPVPVLLAQMLALALLSAWCLGFLRKLGAPWWLTWGIALFLAVTPATGLILLNPWKDIPYAIALIALTALLLKWSAAVHERANLGAPRLGTMFWVSLGITAALAALFRQNGVVVAFGTLALLAIADRPRRKGFGLALFLCVALYFLITGPFYALMQVNTNVESSGQNLGLHSLIAYLVRYHSDSDSALTVEEKELLAELYPGEIPIDLGVVVRRWDDVTRAAYRLSLEYPGVTLRYFLNRASYIFQVLQPPNARVGYVEIAVYENPYGIIAAPKLPGLQPWLTRLAAKTEQVEFDWFFWRNAFWMYLLIFSAAVVSVRTKNWRFMALALPVLLNAVPLAWVSGGHIARYIFSTLILGPILGVGLLFIRPPAADRQLHKKPWRQPFAYPSFPSSSPGKGGKKDSDGDLRRTAPQITIRII